LPRTTSELLCGFDCEGFVKTLTSCVEANGIAIVSIGLEPVNVAVSPDPHCHPAPALFDAELTERLKRVYLKIHDAAPHAHLYVLGYPQIFDRAAPSLSISNCDVHAQDAQKISLVEKHVNGVIEAAVKTLGSWATFIDNEHTFDHHELCRRNITGFNARSYLNGLLVEISKKFAHVESFHPNAAGHEALARKLPTP